MTTLDGVERIFDAETVLVCDRERPTGIAGVMGGQVSEVAGATTRVLLRSRTGTGPTSSAPRAILGLRRRPRPGSRSSFTPICDAGAAGRLAANHRGLRRGSCRGRSTSPPRSRRRTRSSIHAARLALLGIEVPRRPRRRPGAARLRGRDRGRGPRGHGAARPPLRRHPRGRPDRGGRPRPRPRRTCRRRCPRSPSGSAGSAATQRLRRRAEDALGPRLRPDRRLELHRPRRAGGCGSRRGPRAKRNRDREPALRGPIGDAHHAPRLAARRRPPNVARGAEAWYSSSRGASPAGRAPADGGALGRRLRGRAGGTGPRATPARRPRGRAAGAAVLARRRRAADFFALKGVLEALFGPLGAAPPSRPRAEPFLHPGRAAPSPSGAPPPAGSASSTRLSAAAWDLEAAVGFEIDAARRCSPPPAAGEEIRGRHQLPRRPRGPRRDRAGVRRRRGPRRIARRRGEFLHSAGSSKSLKAGRSARA